MQGNTHHTTTHGAEKIPQLSKNKNMPYICVQSGHMALSHTCTHLWSQECENLGKNNVSGESKKDMIAERGEPHGPLEIGSILRQKRTQRQHERRR